MWVINVTFQEEFVEEVRNSCDIVEIISEYVDLKKTGKNFVGKCPFHNEKTPSFTVAPEKQMFYCFGCKTGGNVYTFIMKKENLSFPEAIEFLANKAGIVLPQPDDSAAISQKGRIKNIILEILKDAANYFYYNLIKTESGRHAFEYLIKRGLSKEIIRKFGLGYSLPEWDSTKKFLESKGYDEKSIESAGIIIKGKYNNYYDRFRGRIMFPITDVMGRVIGFGGRTIADSDSQPKYLNTPDTVVYNKRKNLYGLSIAKRESSKKGIIIVEGYMDVIALHQAGFTNAVASLGTSLTIEQAKLIKRYTDEVYLAYDSDEAGKAASIRGMDILNDIGLIVKVIMFPEGLDPDDYIRQKGREEFHNKINEALPLMDYKLMTLKEGYDMSSPLDKREYISKIAPHLLKIKSFVERDAYIRKISETLGIREEALRIDINRYSKKNQYGNTIEHKKVLKTHNNKNNAKFKIMPAHIKAEWDLINLLINEDQVYELIKNNFSLSDFIDDINREIAKIIYSLKNSQTDISPAEIVDKLGREEYVKRFSHIVARDVIYEDAEKTVLDCIAKIKGYKLQQELDNIQQLIKKTEASTKSNEHELNKLLVKYQEILERKKSLKFGC